MRKLATALSVLAIGALVSAAPASAAQHINTLDKTGSQVKELVQAQGSVLLSTGEGLFDRYVANSSYCSWGEEAEAAYVPTANSNHAFVGYTCAPTTDNNG